MTTISAQSILSSRHAVTGDTLHTLLLRYPRWIHAEFMTHRMFSRNAASSRAIPVEKLIQSVLDDPAVPLVWTRNERGMQGYQVLDEDEEIHARAIWTRACMDALEAAKLIAHLGAHKQIVNRLLEPFSHITVVVSATNWSNFLHLRDHKDAEPHIQILAREIRKAIRTAPWQDLQPGEWHTPFAEPDIQEVMTTDDLIKLSVARCASTSYKTVDGFDMTLDRAVALHDKLVAQDPLHASPCEHVAQADGYLGGEDWANPHQHGNFTGFRQYRKMLPGECR